MTSADDDLLGIFPLGMVLLPGEVAPLHIFEPRYRLLVEERLDGGEFGVVLADDDAVREHGCAARVTELVERLDNGRMNILVQGLRRFRVLELREPDDSENEYLRAVVAYYDDAESQVPEELSASVLAVYRKMLELMEVKAPHEPEGREPLSFRIASAVDFGAPLKQELLESVHEEWRLRTLLTVMRTLLPRLELRRDRQEAIRGNGKGY
jgi:ATP-dependent Lon protease